MNISGLSAKKNLWGRVFISDSTGTLRYETTRVSHFLHNKITKIYKNPDRRNEWATIFNTSGFGVNTFIYEIRQNNETLAKIEIISNDNALSRDKTSILNAQGEPIGIIRSNNGPAGGLGLVFSGFTLYDLHNRPIARIDSKDRKARVKLVISATYEIFDAGDLDESWQAIVVAMLILTTAGIIIS